MWAVARAAHDSARNIRMSRDDWTCFDMPGLEALVELRCKPLIIVNRALFSGILAMAGERRKR
jgi:hypothetical protein